MSFGEDRAVFEELRYAIVFVSTPVVAFPREQGTSYWIWMQVTLASVESPDLPNQMQGDTEYVIYCSWLCIHHIDDIAPLSKKCWVLRLCVYKSINILGAFDLLYGSQISSLTPLV